MVLIKVFRLLFLNFFYYHLKKKKIIKWAISHEISSLIKGKVGENNFCRWWCQKLLVSHMVLTYLSHSILSGKLDHQVISWSYDLPWVKGRTAQDGIIGGRIVNNQECDILRNLFRVISNVTDNVAALRGYIRVPPNPTSSALVGTSYSRLILICWNAG